MSFALFDLDQTLLPYDTQVLFCNFVLRRHGWRRMYLPLVLAAAPLRAVRILGNGGMKRVFLSYLWRMPRAHLTELAHEFAEKVVPPLLYPEIAAEVERHRAAGRTLILTTASPEFYASAIARVLKFDHFFGTRILFQRDPLPLVPRMEGENNKRVEKLKRMRHVLGSDLSLPLPGSYAYSDSEADLPMLRYVEHPVAVNPDSHLEQAAKEEQWTILRPPRPHTTRIQFLCEAAWMAAGCWKRP
ncbi:MAG TPA: HAD-IB family hydrolase [Verrucomicrobiales bacterium]|jgi:HAD superfamily hydrolase (TIGR01490 family)|nr:HAD-IB family hydrolase [Verrucomicrobiales bacterium]